MYVQIDGYYERINSLQDISNVIRIYYNSELADKMDEFIEEIDTSMQDDDYRRLEELENIIEDIRMIVG